jgi:hypothetical protein
MKKFNIEESEKSRILAMHKSLLKEQGSATQTKTVDVQLQEFIDNGCFPNGNPTLVKMKSTNPQKTYAVKLESTKTPGKFRYYFIDNTVGEQENGKFTILTSKWSCDKLTPKTTSQLTPQQQKSVDDLINFYNKGPEPLYQKEEPTADQLAKKEWEKVNLKNEDKFEDIIFTDYFIWKKTGLRQTQSPQQKNIITTYTNAGWQDIGGKLNPAEADKYLTIDLKEDYPKEFPESYMLVKLIKSVDIDTLIEELNGLVNSNNFSDRKTCKEIIEKYSAAKNKNAYVDNAVLKNWKIAINACITNKLNYNDLGITNGKIEKLKTPTQVATTTSGTTSGTPAKKDKWAL